MTSRDDEPDERIRRILVALDASPHSLSALDAATELAAQLRAELQGLFVEDENLLRLAQLPFARETGSLSSRSRQMDRAYLERQLRAQAKRARRALERRAEVSRVAWSFRVARGLTAAELMTAASEADLTVMGKGGWQRPGRRLGSTARQMLLQTERLTMFFERGAQLGLPVLVVYDGSPAARRALAAAVHLLRAGEELLTVLVLAEDEESAETLQARAEGWLGDRQLHARFQRLTDVRSDSVVHAIQSEGCQVVVLPSMTEGIPEELVTRLLETLRCPTLLVR
jgi:nucleotide-binding universal stress UspA family protein